MTLGKEKYMPAKQLKAFLDEHDIKYVVISHPIAYTAAETAATAHVSGKDFAKTVMVRLDDELAMAVLRSVDKLDLHLLRSLADAGEARLASEEEFFGRFPGVDFGAMPPFGNLYGMAVYVDEALAKSHSITFNAGSHSEAMHIDWSDYQRLVKPVIARISSDELAAALWDEPRVE
jgi:Ala-tRNA(Pro) deacylase